MAKFRVWYGDDPTYKKVSSLAEAIKFIKKKPDFDESNSGIEEKIDDDYWDEWLDDDDQNVHEHLYMYGGKSKYLKSLDDEDDDDDDLEDDEEEIEDEEAIVDDDDEPVEEDLDDRLMDVIGGGRSPAADVEEVFDDEDDLDDDLDDLDDDDDLDDLDDEDDDDR